MLCKRNGWPTVLSYDEGFLTNTGRFLNRTEAMTLARANGQLRGQTLRTKLNSEDLW